MNPRVWSVGARELRGQLLAPAFALTAAEAEQQTGPGRRRLRALL
jgi:hypothetical protein